MMKPFSEDKFTFRSFLDHQELIARLQRETLPGRSVMMMTFTDKFFIGRISQTSFKLTSTYYPIGGMCVLKGVITGDSVIELTTRLQPGIRILWMILSILVITETIGSWVIEPYGWVPLTVSLMEIIVFLGLFRWMLHGVYVLARNKAIPRLKTIFAVD